MAVDTGKIYRVVYYNRYSNQNGLNVAYYEVVATVGGGATEQEAANALSQAYADAVKPWLNDSAQYYGLSFQQVKPLPVPDAIWSTTAAGDGGNVGDALPQQVAAKLRLFTGFAGRANRGRKYIPFGTETSNTADAINGAGVTLLTDLLVHFASDIGPFGAAGTSTLGNLVYHKASNTGSRVVSGSIDTRWSNQVRRSAQRRADTIPVELQ